MVVFVPGSFCGWSRRLDLLSLVSMLPLLGGGGGGGGYTATYISIQTVIDRQWYRAFS
jgi:hypothetical protein